MALPDRQLFNYKAAFCEVEDHVGPEVITGIRDYLDATWKEHGDEFIHRASGARMLLMGDVDEFALQNAKPRHERAEQLVAQYGLGEIPTFEIVQKEYGTFGNYMRKTQREDLARVYKELELLDQENAPLVSDRLPTFIHQLHQGGVPLVTWYTGRRLSLKERTRENLRYCNLVLDAPVVPFPDLSVPKALKSECVHAMKVMGMMKFVEVFSIPMTLIDDDTHQVTLANRFSDYGIHAVEANWHGRDMLNQVEEIMANYYP